MYVRKQQYNTLRNVLSVLASVIRWSTKIMECSMWGSWRSEPPSETLLMFCKLCWGSENIGLLCVSVTAGSLGFSPNALQQLVDLVLVHGIWCTVSLREVCWLLQNVKYRRLKAFNVTECLCVCVFVYVCVCSVCLCVKHNLVHATVFFWNRKFVVDYCIVTNTDSLIHTSVLSQTQIICFRLLYCHKHRSFVTV